MCIIAIKPTNKPLWNNDLIKNMYENNPDGAGYMYPSDGQVVIRKGFMSVESLISSLHSIANVESLPLILHCRIGTHGDKKSKANTHPFPICDDVKSLQAKKIVTDLGMVHNGVIRGITPRSKISDTMEYILEYLMPIYRVKQDFYKDISFKNIISMMIDTNKLAFLDGMGQIETVGNFVEKDGYKYSNSSYEKREKTVWVSNVKYPTVSSYFDFTKSIYLSKIPDGTTLEYPLEDGGIVIETLPYNSYIAWNGDVYIVEKNLAKFYKSTTGCFLYDSDGLLVTYDCVTSKSYQKLELK